MEEILDRLKVPMDDYLKGDDHVRALLSAILETGIGIVTRVSANKKKQTQPTENGVSLGTGYPGSHPTRGGEADARTKDLFRRNVGSHQRPEPRRPRLHQRGARSTQ